MTAETISPTDPDSAPQRVEYVLEDQVGYLLRRAHQRATAQFTEIMTPFGLTPTQFAALAKIYDQGEVSQNQLGRLTAMDPATSQGVTRRLIEQGLVVRRDDDEDRRRFQLSLTADGRRVIEAAMVMGLKVSAATLEPLTARERATFLTLLKRLG